jgi:hypothetical protein
VSRAAKLADYLFLHGESEKNVPEIICQTARFQIMRFILTMTLKAWLKKLNLTLIAK